MRKAQLSCQQTFICYKKIQYLWHIDIPHVRRGKGKREEKQVSDINLHNEKHVLSRYNVFL